MQQVMVSGGVAHGCGGRAWCAWQQERFPRPLGQDTAVDRGSRGDGPRGQATALDLNLLSWKQL